MRWRAGFTLVELLAVLALIGLAAVIALPYLPRSLGAIEPEASGRLLAHGLRQARGAAMTGGREVVFVVDVGGRRHGIPPTWRALGADVGVAVHAAGDEKLGDRAIGIRFFPDGSSSGGTVRLQGPAQHIEIVVDWLTGAVEVRHAATS